MNGKRYEVVSGGLGPAVIDALIVTHPHVDHFPGASGVVRHFEVCDYYDPAYPDLGVEYQRFLDLVSHGHCGDHTTTMHMGRPSFGSPDGLGHGNTLINNASIVMKLTYGTQSILFMGDAEGKERNDSPDTPKYVEARLLASLTPEQLKSTVLKVAHHGSETSSTLPFIRAVDPAIMVVSSGRKSFAGT